MSVMLLSSATATVVGPPKEVNFARYSAVFQALLYGTSGAVSATVKLWASNDPAVTSAATPDQTNGGKVLLATFTLSGTGGTACAATDAWTVTAPYRRFWAEVTAIAGTGAAVTVIGSV